MYLGDLVEDAIISFPFTTNDGDGGAVLPSGPFDDADFRVYKNDSETQIVTDGLTVTSPFDSVDGLHMVKIDTSVHADYTTGANYSVVLKPDTETVDLQTVVAVLATFSIENRFDKVDVTKINGDTDAADNLKAGWNGIGVLGPTFPSTQSQVGNLTAGSAAPSVTAESFTKVASEPETNDYTFTHEADEVYHIVEDNVADGITDFYYQFDVGGNGVPVDVTWVGYAQGQNDEYLIWAYNYTTSAYERIGHIEASNGTGHETDTYRLTISHVGTVATGELGKVRFRVTSINGSAFATDRLLCSFTVKTDFLGYSNGDIYVDEDGVAGSEPSVNGIVGNPCPWANALVLSAALGLRSFQIASGTTITLDANSSGYILTGHNWALELGGQSIVGSFFEGAVVSGVAAGAGTNQTFHDCLMGITTHIKGTHVSECGISGTQIAGEAGNYYFDRCHSAIAGTDTWIFDFGDAIGSTNLNFRNGSSGIRLESMGDTGTDTASIEGRGQIIEGTCTGGVVAVRGMFTRSFVVTNNITWSEDSRYDVKRVWDRLLTGSTHNIPTSAGRRLREIMEIGLYEGRMVWVDTVNGLPGSVNYDNGTRANPVDNIADALIIAINLKLPGFRILDGSSILLESPFDNYEFTGVYYTVNLGGQSVDGACFEQAVVLGNDDGSNTRKTLYRRCVMESNILGQHVLEGCRLSGSDLTLAEIGDYFWDQCYSGIAGTDTPGVDFSAVGNQNLSLRHHSGGIKVKRFSTGGIDNMSLEGFGQLILDVSCNPSGVIAIRGHFGPLTDNVVGGFVAGGGTLSDDANFDITEGRILAATGLDAISVAQVVGPATTIPQQIAQLWRAEYKKRILHKIDTGSGTLQYRNDADDGDLLSSTYTEDTTDQVIDASV